MSLHHRTMPQTRLFPAPRTLWLMTVAAVVMCGFAVAQDVELQSRVFEIARQLRCPVCVSESVADSNAQLAQQMRQLIQQQLEEGRSEAQIFSYFTNRYGDWIMLDPPKRGIHLVVWVLPVIAGLAGLAVVALLVRRWMATARQPIEVGQDSLDRVRAELENGDG
ncbi:MAG TPA: cytochrome c-type biogenesis protein [Trueperaceae bacterium]|nr:cytochrome c-type biogenesis protein [Trueperaceae bacterium]